MIADMHDVSLLHKTAFVEEPNAAGKLRWPSDLSERIQMQPHWKYSKKKKQQQIIQLCHPEPQVSPFAVDMFITPQHTHV